MSRPTTPRACLLSSVLSWLLFSPVLAGIDPSSKRVAIVGSEPDGSNAWHEVVPLAARKADTAGWAARAKSDAQAAAADAARAARNIGRVSLQEAAKLNTLDLCQYQKIVVSAKALDAIIARVNGGKN